jgi:hypothetical protein
MIEETEYPESESEFMLVTEKRMVHRITLSYLITSLLDAFNLERGGIYTVKRLFSHPANMLRAYLGKQRYRFTPPFRLLLITTAVALFLLNVSGEGSSFLEGVKDGLNSQGDATGVKLIFTLQRMGEFINLILWSFIPLMALFTWLFNKKKSFNYAEHLVMQTYLFSIINLIMWLFPLASLLHLNFFMIVISCLMYGYYIYFYRFMFRKSWVRAIAEGLLVFHIASLLWFVVLAGIFIVLMKF